MAASAANGVPALFAAAVACTRRETCECGGAFSRTEAGFVEANNERGMTATGPMPLMDSRMLVSRQIKKVEHARAPRF